MVFPGIKNAHLNSQEFLDENAIQINKECFVPGKPKLHDNSIIFEVDRSALKKAVKLYNR